MTYLKGNALIPGARMRLFWMFLGLAVLFLIPFLIWGGVLETIFSPEGAVSWLEGYGVWAWAAGTLLLMLDLFLPIPGTIVMSAMGFVYGPVWGGLLSVVGSFLSGSLAYSLCRLLGPPAALKLLGERDMKKGETLFSNVGGWIVVLSRWLPLVPEVVSCMAGLTRMPARTFHLALACGSVPLGFVFAAVGHAGVTQPLLALGLSAVLPPVLWIVVQPVFEGLRRQKVEGRR